MNLVWQQYWKKSITSMFEHSLVFLSLLARMSVQIQQMRSSRKHRTKARKPNDVSSSSDFAAAAAPAPQEQICYEGENLARLLKSVESVIESARLVDTTLPRKIWLKQQFCIGVNDVTRVLERMAPNAIKGSSSGHRLPTAYSCRSKAPTVELQAILLASDCNPRWLTRHLPSMASSRKVPLIFVKDKKGGSARLGELVKLKTAIAIGVKVKGNAINQHIGEILQGKLERIA